MTERRKKPRAAGACTNCGRLVETWGEADISCRACGGVMEQSYRLPPMEECQACDGTGAELNVAGPASCRNCEGWGWRAARTAVGTIKTEYRYQ